MKKIIIYNDESKTGMCRSNKVLAQEIACVEIRKNIEKCNYDGGRFGRPNI